VWFGTSVFFAGHAAWRGGGFRPCYSPALGSRSYAVLFVLLPLTIGLLSFEVRRVPCSLSCVYDIDRSIARSFVRSLGGSLSIRRDVCVSTSVLNDGVQKKLKQGSVRTTRFYVFEQGSVRTTRLKQGSVRTTRFIAYIQFVRTRSYVAVAYVPPVRTVARVWTQRESCYTGNDGALKDYMGVLSDRPSNRAYRCLPGGRTCPPCGPPWDLTRMLVVCLIDGRILDRYSRCSMSYKILKCFHSIRSIVPIVACLLTCGLLQPLSTISTRVEISTV